VRSLRKTAPKIVGMLIDHLLDVDVDPRVRRRIPRILKVVRTQRSASGLVLALRDPVFEVRIQVAIALGQMLQEDPSLKVERETIFDIALHELTTGRATWSTARTGSSVDGERSGADEDVVRSSEHDGRASGEAPDGDELRRGLAHIFAVLGLVLEREPLSIAYRALRSDDASLRGTAFEYLEVVLPTRLRDLIVPLLGDVKPAPRSRDRGSSELVAELLRSQGGAMRPAR
jgi:HEAT repeat protein